MRGALTLRPHPALGAQVAFYNTEAKMREWILYSAWHQEEALRYFNADAERRQRFVVVDLEQYVHDAVPMLLWAARSELSKHRTTEVVDHPQKLPAGWMEAARPIASAYAVPSANSK